MTAERVASTTAVVAGRKYDKLVRIEGHDGGRQALAFRNRETGKWFEAASWAKPSRRLANMAAINASLPPGWSPAVIDGSPS